MFLMHIVEKDMLGLFDIKSPIKKPIRDIKKGGAVKLPLFVDWLYAKA